MNLFVHSDEERVVFTPSPALDSVARFNGAS